ncbi:MAG: TGS domain-containing protein, partial [Clostridia bacterium]|nr:TGS domain-containing protein [Clostridia bacterium]
MINITLKGGTVKEFDAGVTPYEVAKSIGAGMTYVLAKAYVNGRIQTKHFRIYSGDRIETVKV